MLRPHYDVCIVGAGIAGSLVAENLARKGASVVLVEAGRKWDLGERFNQVYRQQVLATPFWPWIDQKRDAYVDNSVDQLGYSYDLNELRVKGVGGSTLHWGGLAQRMRESDFETYSRYGVGSDWPISYAELEPFYVAAEHEIGVSGGQNRTDPPRSKFPPMPAFPVGYADRLWEPTFEKLGVDFSHTTEARNSTMFRGRSQCVAYSVCRACPSGARYSADFHADLAVATGNCDLLTNTSARMLELRSAGHIGILHATSPSGDIEIRAKRFVVACHAIESARLLLLSGLQRISDHIGRYLMEHWYASAGGFHEDQLFPGRLGFSTLESNHFYEGSERTSRGAIKLEFGVPNADRTRSKLLQGVWGEDLKRYECDTFGHYVHVGAEIEHQPNRDSFVKLSETERDRFGDPVPEVHFALSEFDRATHKRGLEISELLLEARGVTDINKSKRFGPGGHHMGTLRMATSPDEGVVDADCLMHGMDNLYCVGSSVFTTSGARQPTLTIAALALRLANHLSRTRF